MHDWKSGECLDTKLSPHLLTQLLHLLWYSPPGKTLTRVSFAEPGVTGTEQGSEPSAVVLSSLLVIERKCPSSPLIAAFHR